MAGSTLTAQAYVVKKVHADRRPENLAKRDRLLLNAMKMTDGFYGEDFRYSMQQNNPQSASAGFTNAWTTPSGSAGKLLVATRAKYFGVITVDYEFELATSKDIGAFTRGLMNEIDGVSDEMGRRLSIFLYGNGSGSLARNSVGTASPITLLNPDDAKNFAINMRIVANPNETGNIGTLRAGVGTVTGINEDTGVITFSGTITSLAATDFIYAEGDYDAAVKGLRSQIPLTAPTGGDSFRGIDRSVDVNKLAGWRVNGTAQNIYESLHTLGARVKRGGGKPDVITLSPGNYATLEKELMGMGMYYIGESVVIGFDGIKVSTPAGNKTTAIADPDCPSDAAWMLTLKDWEFRYMGPGVPHVITKGNKGGNDRYNEAATELRVGFFGDAICYAPVRQGVSQLA